MKVVINRCFGGFSLSARAVARIAELLGSPCYFFQTDYKKGINAPLESVTLEEIEAQTSRIGQMMFSAYDIPNPDELLAYPDGTDYEIDEYDGMETIDEKHRSWA